MSCAESPKSKKLSESIRKGKVGFSKEQNKKKQGSSMWSEEDDISLVKGMIDYEVQKQDSPYNDMGKFLDFVKPFIHFDVKRKQVTNRLWEFKHKYIDTCKFDACNPHHAYLFKLSKRVKAWGYVDDRNVDAENVVVDDVVGAKCSKVVENNKGGNVVTGDDQKNVDEENVVLSIVDGGCSEVVKKKKEGEVVISKGQIVQEFNVVVDDVDGGKFSKVVKDKKKGMEVVTSDGQNVVDDVVVVNEVGGDGRNSVKVVKIKNKGKVVILNVEEENVIVDEVDGGKSEQVVKDKNKEKVLTSDDQNVEEQNVVVDDDGGKCSKGDKVKRKGEVLVCDGQNVQVENLVGLNVGEENLVVDDVGGGKCSTVVKNKKKRKVVISDGQNDEEDNVVVIDVHSSKKNGEKRVNVVGNENVPKEAMKKDLIEFTSMYPHLTKVIELEMLSMMPLHIKKNFVMDMINFVGREKANELEEKWADLHLMEIELDAKEFDMTDKQIKLILEAMCR